MPVCPELSLQEAIADLQELVRLLHAGPGPATEIFLQGGQRDLDAPGKSHSVPMG